MDLRLDGKVAFVTGASKGIGRCVAESLAREGSDVVVTARNAGPLEAAAEKIAAGTGRAVLPLAGDMSVTADVQRCVDATRSGSASSISWSPARAARPAACSRT